MGTSTLIESRLPCPNCDSSDAYHRYNDGHGYCFSCNTRTKSNGELTEIEYTYQYVPCRGLTADTLKFYDIKTKVDGEGKPLEMGYVYPNGSCKVRDLVSKHFRWSKDNGIDPIAGVFGKDKFSFGANKSVTITEGELDAASLYQVLGTPVVSVQSAATAARDVAADRSWLNAYEKVYLAFDDDAPGRAATQAVARLFDYNKVFVVRFTPYKDANEWLQQSEGAFELRNIWWNSKRFLPETIVSSFKDFREVLKEEPKWGVAYPFSTLTGKTYGIRTGESVLITAQEGVGKTELMHAILHKLLKETDDGVGAIFLEEPKRRLLQAIAGFELQKPVHLPDSGCTPDQVASALERVVKEDDRLYVYSHFGSDDPEVLLDTIRFMVSARNVRYVFLDHITMAVSGSSGEMDERRELDYLATKLETMVKELDFALIIVSHVNDFGQTRGSRYISKIADIRIDATRDLTNADPVKRNSTILTISKNRYCGKTGPAGVVLFDAAKSKYEELEADNDNSPSTVVSKAA